MHVREATCDDAAAIARVHVASWRTTYRGIMPDSVLDNLSVEARERQWRRDVCEPGTDAFVYVALDGLGAVVGFASGGPERTGDPEHQGELYAIYLLASHQGRGLGRSLVAMVRGRLQTQGLAGMLIWVAAANEPARRFYEAMGGRAVRCKSEPFFGVEVEEVGYGWS
jgi:ribosomal protein S18 acetylase RimI-like enzyme